MDRMLGHPPSHDRFSNLILKEVRSAGYDGPMVYEADQFRFRHGQGAYFFLTNAYNEYVAAARSARAQVLRRYARVFLVQEDSTEISFEEARSMLVPVIRNLAGILDIDNNRLLDGVEPQPPLQMRPFGPDCVELLALDRPDATTTLTCGPPETWGITLDQALDIARDNLREATHQDWKEVAKGVVQGPWADDYEPSRALMPDVLERAPVKGRPVFMIPTRNVLLVTGDRDEPGLREMLELSHRAFEQGGRWISAQLYTFDENRKPVVFTLPAGEIREYQRDLERLLLGDSYASQKAFLEKRYELEARDVFVATYALHQKQGSPCLLSWCTWAEDVDSLLPMTDRIALAQQQADAEGGWTSRVVQWDAAMEIIGHLLEEEPGHYPPRFHTKGFPGAFELARLVDVGL